MRAFYIQVGTVIGGGIKSHGRATMKSRARGFLGLRLQKGEGEGVWA